MYCTRRVTDDITWVGSNDRRLAMFEGVYSVPNGVSYNSYLLTDDSTVLFDTVDKAVAKVFFENVEQVLGGRTLDYIVVQHMEPDHSATLCDLLIRHPEAVVVCSNKTKAMMDQFFNYDFRTYIVDEESFLNTGHHMLRFVMAPMVHWPEVMVTYDETDKILFSADAFGTFGALNGALFADEVNFERDYLDEARRYYCNIVGKYGQQVQALLKKAASLEIAMICPLHGFVWRKNLSDFISKYVAWSSYTPEENGVMIAYASVYGNTENTAEIISTKLRERNVKTVMFDVSVTPASELVAAVFQYSHLLFASTTYNAGIFVSMENALRDIAAHNIQNRTVYLVQNGSWAPTSGNLMKEILSKCKNITIPDAMLTLKSSLKKEQKGNLDNLVDAIADSLNRPSQGIDAPGEINSAAMFKLSYGIYVLTARDGNRDNGCIINTAQLLTDQPKRITVAVNKQNYTHDIIKKTGVFNVSVLTQDAPFSVYKHYGFQSGYDTDKFADADVITRMSNNIACVTEHVNAVIAARVVNTMDYPTHTLFVAEVTEAKVLSEDKSVTYDYYFEHIKPQPIQTDEPKKGFVCKICGYVYEGDELPDDFICPLCKHGAEDFEPLS